MKNLFSSSFDDKLKTTAKSLAADATPVAVVPPATPAATPAAPDFTPCPACGSHHFWFDRFGAGPRCSVCHPWPSRSLVAYKTIGGHRVPERGENLAGTTLDGAGDSAGRSTAELDREWDRNWTTTERELCAIWPNGRIVTERHGAVTREMRLAFESLNQQERRRIKAERAEKVKENATFETSQAAELPPVTETLTLAEMIDAL